MNMPDDKTLLDLIEAGKINLTNLRRNRDNTWSWFDQTQGPVHNHWERAEGGFRECVSKLIKPDPSPVATPEKSPRQSSRAGGRAKGDS